MQRSHDGDGEYLLEIISPTYAEAADTFPLDHKVKDFYLICNVGV